MNKCNEPISNTSTAINFLGIPSIVMYMEEILKNYPKQKNKIISVGSGGGYIEKLLDKLLDINIICIDPEPLSYITEKKYINILNIKVLKNKIFH